MSQTSYSQEAPRAFRGGLAHGGMAPYIETRVVEEAGGVEFGQPLMEGTDPENQAILPVNASSVFQGIAVHRHAVSQGNYALSGDLAAEQGETVDCLRRGQIWVEVETAVAPGDDVYWTHAPGSTGAWRNDATNAVQVPNATFRTTASIGELAMIELNMP